MFARLQLAFYSLLTQVLILKKLSGVKNGSLNYYFNLLATQEHVFYMEKFYNIPELSFEDKQDKLLAAVTWQTFGLENSWKTAKSLVINFALCSNYIYFI
jgi:hypothetical protein